MSEAPKIVGLHHITIVCVDAQRTVDFYTGVLGMRLVKQTVNFDDPGSYHLYFGDDTGAPGTVVTFFEWPGAARGRTGIGGTHHVAFRVGDRPALLRWKRRLHDLGLSVLGPYDRRYFTSIYCTDPDGTILEIATEGPGWTVDEALEALGETVITPPANLLKGGRDEVAIAAETWPEPVPEIDAGMTLARGMHHITAISSDLERTDAYLRGVLGLRRLKRTVNYDNTSEGHWYWGAESGQPGTLLTYFGADRERSRRAQMGGGLTHHYAFAVADAESQEWFRDRLVQQHLPASPVLDRVYFQSVYSRDPDGHIVELATAGPGFLVDEDRAALGQALRLPPWLERDRASIAAGLKPLRLPAPRQERVTRSAPAVAAASAAPAGPTLVFGASDPHAGVEVERTGSPLLSAEAALVLLHGRGAGAEDILTLWDEVVRPGIAALAPEAAGRTWYPQSFLAPLERNEPYLSSALRMLGKLLHDVAAAGIPAERTVLVGFSQGACLALEFAARNARRFGGVVAFSGGLIGPPGTPRDYRGSLVGTPVFLGCSDRDPHIPKERVEESADVLSRLGGEVEMRIYPGLGHTINEDELGWLRGLLGVFG